MIIWREEKVDNWSILNYNNVIILNYLYGLINFLWEVNNYKLYYFIVIGKLFFF